MKTAIIAVMLLTAVRNDGQWADNSPNIQRWFQQIMQPDNPSMSCCGEADAFEADDFEVEDDHYLAVITDGRGVIRPGTKIPVPNHKMKWDRGNPVGHGFVFLSTPTTVADPPAPGYVYVLREGNQARVLYCYVAPTGI